MPIIIIIIVVVVVSSSIVIISSIIIIIMIIIIVNIVRDVAYVNNPRSQMTDDGTTSSNLIKQMALI